jgi:hypothetical protein
VLRNDFPFSKHQQFSIRFANYTPDHTSSK